MKTYKRRRGAGIVETPDGIVLVKDRKYYYLPGGGAERNESRQKAFLRELEEELKIKENLPSYLFDYKGIRKKSFSRKRPFRDYTKIFRISTQQIPVPSHEIKQILYYKKGMKVLMDKDTQRILKKYYRSKLNGIF